MKKKSQPWLQDVFQFMRQHVEVLLLPSSDSSNCSTSTGGKEKGDRRGRNEQEEAPLEKNQRRCAATTESGSGIEVELRAQSPLPEDWEQFLDLKVGYVQLLQDWYRSRDLQQTSGDVFELSLTT